MTKEDKFLIFVIEYYRKVKHLTGREVVTLFSQYDIYNLIYTNYFLYHIETPNNFVREIDEKIVKEQRL